MPCFDNFIEVDGTCSDVAPTSGLFLKDIGISVPFLDQIVTEEYDNGVDLANSKVDFALKTVFNRVLNHFSSRVKPATILESARIGHTDDNTIVKNGDGKLKGIEVELCNLNSFVDFYLSELSIHVTSTGNVDVFVYDLFENKLIDTIPVAAVANEIVTVFPNKTYFSERKNLNLIFVYDSTGLNSIQTSVENNKKTCCGGDRLTRINQFISACGASVDSGDPKINKNIDNEAFTGGLSVMFSLNCNLEKWMCVIRNQIALPVLYAAGIQIIEHALLVSPNDRVNTTVTINKEDLAERLDLYNMKFEKSLENILHNIKLPNDKFCFLCNERSRNTVILP